MDEEYSDLYRTVCLTISGRAKQVDWSGWSAETWKDFYELAKAQGVAPLVHWTFKEDSCWPENTPGEVRKQFGIAYYESTAFNQLLYQELDRILTVLDREKIPVVLLKGAALALSLYQDIGLRPMNDLDLMVSPDHLGKAIKKLQELGYVHQLTTNHSLLKGGGEKPFDVELHWSLVSRISDRRKSNILWFWENTWTLERFFGFQKQQTPLILNPTANLVYLSSHLVEKHGHQNAQLLWFYDLFLLLTHLENKLNYTPLYEFVCENQLGWVLNEAIVSTHKKFDHTFPSNLNALFDHAGFSNFQFDDQKKYSKNLTGFRKIFFHTLYLKRVMMIRAMFSVFFPNPMYMRWRYGCSSILQLLLSYPYRWYRLFVDYFFVF